MKKFWHSSGQLTLRSGGDAASFDPGRQEEAGNTNLGYVLDESRWEADDDNNAETAERGREMRGRMSGYADGVEDTEDGLGVSLRRQEQQFVVGFQQVGGDTELEEKRRQLVEEMKDWMRDFQRMHDLQLITRPGGLEVIREVSEELEASSGSVREEEEETATRFDLSRSGKNKISRSIYEELKTKTVETSAVTEQSTWRDVLLSAPHPAMSRDRVLAELGARGDESREHYCRQPDCPYNQWLYRDQEFPREEALAAWEKRLQRDDFTIPRARVTVTSSNTTESQTQPISCPNQEQPLSAHTLNQHNKIQQQKLEQQQQQKKLLKQLQEQQLKMLHPERGKETHELNEQHDHKQKEQDEVLEHMFLYPTPTLPTKLLHPNITSPHAGTLSPSPTYPIVTLPSSTRKWTSSGETRRGRRRWWRCCLPGGVSGSTSWVEKEIPLKPCNQPATINPPSHPALPSLPPYTASSSSSLGSSVTSSSCSTPSIPPSQPTTAPSSPCFPPPDSSSEIFIPLDPTDPAAFTTKDGGRREVKSRFKWDLGCLGFGCFVVLFLGLLLAMLYFVYINTNALHAGMTRR